MLKRSTALLLVLILAVIAALPAFADTGPKPSLTLTVKNPPDEPYYIDLLMQNSSARSDDDRELQYLRENYSGSELEMLLTIYNYSEDGWQARLGSMVGGRYTASNGSHRYTFDYNNVPNEFRVLIVTESGRVIVSETCERRAYQAVFTYDVETNELHEELWKSEGSKILNFLVTLAITLLIEGLVFVIFRFRFWEGHNYIVFLATNLSTQLLLYLSVRIVLFIIPAELAIIVIEAVVYTRLFVPKKRSRTIAYAVTANLASFFIGLPLWGLFTYLGYM